MSIHGGVRMDSKQAARAVIFDRRLLKGCIFAAVLALGAWCAALSIDYWYVTSCPGGHYLRQTGVRSLPSGYMMAGRAGLWRTCRVLLHNVTNLPAEVQVVTACRSHHFSSVEGIPEDDPANVVIGYRRSSLAFCVLSGILLMLAIFFSWYTLRVPRYTFKRVSGCLYFLVAGVEQVVIAVQDMTIEQEKEIPNAIPRTCSWSYSVSFILAWICFTVHVMCGLGFIYTSGKKKKRTHGTEPIPGLDEGEDENDEPFIMGR